MENKLPKLIKQIEFYMSDDNLKNDKFFNKLLRSSENKEIPVNVLMNCRKIQNLTSDINDIKKSIKESKQLYLSENEEKFGRNKKHVPILREKRIFVTFDENYKLTEEEEKLEENFVIFHPLIIEFSSLKKLFYKGRDLERKLAKMFNVEISYIKIAKKKGYLVFNKKTADPKGIEEILKKEEIELDNFVLTVKKMSEEDTIKWDKMNRNALELGLKMKYHASIKKEKIEHFGKKAFFDENFGPISVAKKNFENMRDLKFFMKNLIARSKNGTEVLGEDFEVIKEVFSYHPDPKKTENLIKIKIDVNPTYKISRCFLMEKANGEIIDISFHKCLANLFNEKKSKIIK